MEHRKKHKRVLSAIPMNSLLNQVLANQYDSKLQKLEDLRRGKRVKMSKKKNSSFSSTLQGNKAVLKNEVNLQSNDTQPISKYKLRISELKRQLMEREESIKRLRTSQLEGLHLIDRKYKEEIQTLREEYQNLKEVYFDGVSLEQKLKEHTSNVKREYERKVKALMEHNCEIRKNNEMLELRVRHLEAKLLASRSNSPICYTNCPEKYCRKCQAFIDVEEKLSERLTRLKSYLSN